MFYSSQSKIYDTYDEEMGSMFPSDLLSLYEAVYLHHLDESENMFVLKHPPVDIS